MGTAPLPPDEETAWIYLEDDRYRLAALCPGRPQYYNTFADTYATVQEAEAVAKDMFLDIRHCRPTVPYINSRVV
jgi:hypothetical protein